jgi:hypothetical protein
VSQVVNVEISHSFVKVEGFLVKRPSSVSVKVWMEFWEVMAKGDYDDGWEDGFSAGYEKGWRDRSENNEYDERPE